MSAASQQPSGRSSVITRALACVGCGYDLRGVAVDEVCPECGETVERSLREPILANSSPEYVLRLERGALWMAAATLATLVTVVLVPLALSVLEADPAQPRRFHFVLFGLLMLPTVTSVWATWMFTSPDPRFTLGDQPGAARKLARGCVLIMFAAEIARILLAMYGITAQFSPATIAAKDPRPWVALAATLLGWTAWVVHFFAVMRYCRWLARRIPDAKLERDARRYQWSLPLWSTVGVVIFGPLVAAVKYSRYFWRFRRELRRQRLQGDGAGTRPVPGHGG